jgi:intracellular sulfur oxidation DsrE/DsrF family protein
MKTTRWSALILVASAATAFAVHKTSHAQGVAAKAHNIVFEVNVAGQEEWNGILNNVQNLQKALGRDNTHIEVVAHGKGLALILATDTGLAERLRQIAGSGVVFSACENTMRKENVRREDLFPFAATVPSGITEVVLKQEAGWSYVKGG